MLGPRREVYTTPKLPGLSEAMNSAASSLAGWSAFFRRCKRERSNSCAIGVHSHKKQLPIPEP